MSDQLFRARIIVRGTFDGKKNPDYFMKAGDALSWSPYDGLQLEHSRDRSWRGPLECIVHPSDNAGEVSGEVEVISQGPKTIEEARLWLGFLSAVHPSRVYMVQEDDELDCTKFFIRFPSS